ncbi:MAG TPA: hypothetical protein DD490_09070 [Acidobacteria bacterium]|nr:hypothetical protein [Acidobacteriota bacterium]
MSLDFKDANPAPGGVLEVTVQGKLGQPGLTPQTITLTDQVHTVRWRCVNLAKGSRLEIHIAGDPKGPFVELRAAAITTNPAEVQGFGNRGPRKTLKEYAYEARIVRRGGLSRSAGSGTLRNQAKKAVGHPLAGGLGEPQPDPIGG